MTAKPQLMLNQKLYQASKPDMELHMINMMYAALSMRTQTEKTAFSCKDDCSLTKHTWRCTYSTLWYFYASARHIEPWRGLQIREKYCKVEYVQHHVCFVYFQSPLHENAVFSVCAHMGNAAYIIFIMWNSISGLDSWYHFRFNISCSVAVKLRSHQKKYSGNIFF